MIICIIPCTICRKMSKMQEKMHQKYWLTENEIFYIIIEVLSGCGSAWLERLVWDQEVAGSNPVTPTEKEWQDHSFFHWQC